MVTTISKTHTHRCGDCLQSRQVGVDEHGMLFSTEHRCGADPALLLLSQQVSDELRQAERGEIPLVRCGVCRCLVMPREQDTHCEAEDVEYYRTHPQRRVHNEHHQGENRITDLSCYWCA